MMCLRDSPWSLCIPGPVGQKTLVKISSPSRRSPWSARPSTDSARVLAYTSAVSKVVMPSSSARRTQARAASSSTWDPWVSQLPYAISETLRPLLPRLRVCMGPTLVAPPTSAVEVEHDLLGGGVRLTGEHVAALDLVRLQRVVGVHGDGPLDEPGTAGAADAALAGERQVGAYGDRGVQHGLAVRPEVQRRGAAVEPDRHVGSAVGDVERLDRRAR